MIDARAHGDREAERRSLLHRSRELHRDGRLVVVHRDDAGKAAVRADAEGASAARGPTSSTWPAFASRAFARAGMPGVIERDSSLPRRPPSPAWVQEATVHGGARPGRSREEPAAQNTAWPLPYVMARDVRERGAS